MSLSLGIFTFINAWWVTLFFVLPFAGKTPNWKKLLIINSAISFTITAILAAVIHSGFVSLNT